VLDANSELYGVITRNQLAQLYKETPAEASTIRLSEIARTPMVAFADEPLRSVVNQMADSGFTRFPVLDRESKGKIVGMVALNDLLHARVKNLEDERARERVLRIRMPFGGQMAERKIRLTEGADFPNGSGQDHPQPK
jgi:CBS-domain-containing membrane protein